MQQPILHPLSGVRILRPSEARLLIDAFPKVRHRDRFEFLLYTGVRYSEGVDLHGKEKRLDGNKVKIKNMKYKVKERFRYVHLNVPGQRAVQNYLRMDKPLPHYATWGQNLKRWAKDAGLSPNDDDSYRGLSVKTTRKTWESWLVAKFPELWHKILLSQGHSERTSINHYLSLPFSSEDLKDMDYFVYGWND